MVSPLRHTVLQAPPFFHSLPGGESTKMMPREIRVSIPPGVRNLMELRIPGAGHAGSRGGKAGHLFVQVTGHSCASSCK